MGTSSSDPGPTGVNPLLPPWTPAQPSPDFESDVSDYPADEHPDQPTNPDSFQPLIEPLSWKGARRVAKELASSGANRGSRATRYARYAASRSIRSLGGSRGATASARGGRRTAAGLAGFFASAAKHGVSDAARRFGIDDYLGGDVETFLAALVDVIAPDGAFTEDAVARRAAIDALEELFEHFGVDTEGLSALDNLTAASVETALEVYASSYVFERIVQALTAQIEAHAFAASRAADVERILHDYIRAEVRMEAGDRDFTTVDWSGTEGHLLLGELFERSFAILEAAGADDDM